MKAEIPHLHPVYITVKASKSLTTKPSETLEPPDKNEILLGCSKHEKREPRTKIRNSLRKLFNELLLMFLQVSRGEYRNQVEWVYALVFRLVVT